MLLREALWLYWDDFMKYSICGVLKLRSLEGDLLSLPTRCSWELTTVCLMTVLILLTECFLLLLPLYKSLDAKSVLLRCGSATEFLLSLKVLVWVPPTVYLDLRASFGRIKTSSALTFVSNSSYSTSYDLCIFLFLLMAWEVLALGYSYWESYLWLFEI